MIEFIENHYLLLIAAVGFVVEVIVLIRSFRKGKVNQEDFIENIIDKVLPGYINLAEASGADGVEKLALVVKLAIEQIKRYITSGSEEFYRKLIIQKVEAILSTPQKKEKL